MQEDIIKYSQKLIKSVEYLKDITYKIKDLSIEDSESKLNQTRPRGGIKYTSFIHHSSHFYFIMYSTIHGQLSS